MPFKIRYRLNRSASRGQAAFLRDTPEEKMEGQSRRSLSRSTGPLLVGGAYTARQLPSGDWKIMFSTEEARRQAETLPGRAQLVFGEEATVARKSYMVVARGLVSRRFSDERAADELQGLIKAEKDLK